MLILHIHKGYFHGHHRRGGQQVVGRGGRLEGAAIGGRPASVRGVASTTAAATICTTKREVDDFFGTWRGGGEDVQ